MEHIWRVADEHLTLIEDATLAPALRDFAVQVIVASFEHEPSEWMLARTFEVLQCLVDRDDPLVADLLPFVPAGPSGNPQGTVAAITKLGARAIVRGHRHALVSILGAMLSLDAPVPADWMKVFLDLTPDAELRIDLVHLFFEWAQSKSADASAQAAMLADRPALRTAYEEVRSEYVEWDRQNDSERSS